MNADKSLSPANFMCASASCAGASLPPGFWVGGERSAGWDDIVAVAEGFGLPPVDAPVIDAYGLWLGAAGWELRAPAAAGFAPLRLDFSLGATATRLRQAGRKQPLARAVGLKPGVVPKVVDATAGLGRDGAVLAQLGCEVLMIERSAVMALLLRDGLLRTAPAPVAERVSVLQGDARHELAQLARDADVIYLDPMYPHRSKSALVKKEMRMVRDLVGDDPDAGDLLAAALASGARRVAVKRPGGAPTLPGPAPLGCVEGPNTRYDLYAPQADQPPSQG